MFSLFQSKKRSPDAVFSSYDDALRAAGGEGYQHDELVRIVVEKNAIFRDRLMAAEGSIGLESSRPMLGIAALGHLPTISVLDFGGGGGSQYFMARKILGPDRPIRWNVVETTAMAHEADKKLAGGGLKFFDDLEQAKADLGHVDLLFTSGTLPSTPDPLGFLSRLVSVKADHLFITRTSFSTDDETIICLQPSKLSHNGPGPLPAGFEDRLINYPLTLASKANAEAIIKRFYNIRFRITEDRNAYKINGKGFDMYGYFCDLLTPDEDHKTDAFRQVSSI